MFRATQYMKHTFDMPGPLSDTSILNQSVAGGEDRWPFGEEVCTENGDIAAEDSTLRTLSIATCFSE